ncbi:hypothetical protein [Kribbella sp. NPDC050469]
MPDLSESITVGARFIGHNRVGAIHWFTFGRVVDAAPGEPLPPRPSSATAPTGT